MSGCGKLEMSAVKESGGIGVGTDRDEREACFLEFARDIAADAGMPVMTTGGIGTAKSPSRFWPSGWRWQASPPRRPEISGPSKYSRRLGVRSHFHRGQSTLA